MPRESEFTPESSQTFLAALTQINSVSPLQKLMGKHGQVLSLEIALMESQIYFLITCDSELAGFIEAQIKSNYPVVSIEKIKDPVAAVTTPLVIKELQLSKITYLPINTYDSYKDVDPLSSILSVLSKAPENEFSVVQFCLEAVGSGWQASGQRFAEQGGGKNAEGIYQPHPQAQVMKEKISYPGFAVSLRIAATSGSTVTQLASTFGVYARSDGNTFASAGVSLFAKKPIRSLIARDVTSKQILNIKELASLWHLPGDKIKTASIAWGKTVLSEPPENLPISIGVSDEDKFNINFFAKTVFHNQEATFGLKQKDRRRHMWVVGKSGTGKSTLITNMAIDDIKKGRGLAIIDPHGDLVETILDYIPKNRINDTIYFNPADKDFPIVINPLEVRNKDEAELVVAGIMSIFTKIWAGVWSARMEYIMRNSLMTLAEVPEATLADVLALLVDSRFRTKIINQLKDPALIHFWKDEYEKMPDRLQSEAISPIQNKVGQFVTSPMVRRIIGHPKSSVDLGDVMNGSKIFLANLSQGRLGEDNSALLGATLITKFQLAAMHRVETPEAERKDFHLYVDEFQNFATESFIKILSEARKYHLNLMLANQYMAQIPDEVQKAILGNVGSLVCFTVGAEDAAVIHKEYAEVFSENDLVNLQRFQIAVRLMIDDHATRPFFAITLPLPQSSNQNRDKVERTSRERFGKKYEEQPYVPIVPNSPPQQQPRQYGQGQRRPQQQAAQPRHTGGQQNRPDNRQHENKGVHNQPYRPQQAAQQTQVPPKPEPSAQKSGTLFAQSKSQQPK